VGLVHESVIFGFFEQGNLGPVRFTFRRLPSMGVVVRCLTRSRLTRHVAAPWCSALFAEGFSVAILLSARTL